MSTDLTNMRDLARLADELRAQRNAALDQLADISALAGGLVDPDERSGGAPVLGEAWEAVCALRRERDILEKERDEMAQAGRTAVECAEESFAGMAELLVDAERERDELRAAIAAHEAAWDAAIAGLFEGPICNQTEAADVIREHRPKAPEESRTS